MKKGRKSGVSFFFLSWIWEPRQLVGTMRLVQREQRSVGDISLCHTLTHSHVNIPSSLNLFLHLWLNQGVMTLWQLHKKAQFEVKMWGACQGGLSRVSLCTFVCEFVNAWCMLRVTGGGPRGWEEEENLKMAWLMAWLPRLI